MKRLPAFWQAAAMALTTTAGAQAPTAPEPPAFLAGCWEQRSAELLVQEQWMAPLDGQALGLSRTLRGGRLVGFEFMRIERTPQGLDFVAQPGGRPPTRFALVKQSETALEFHNPAHDFPQTIRYTLQAPGELLAQIEGPSKSQAGQTRTIDFRYRRVACP
jgi:hypothetical protein